MNKKKCLTGLIAIIILSSLIFSTFIVKAYSPRTVWGKVYIDGELAPDGITVKLTFSGQEITNDTYENGNYVMNFLEDNYEEGTFSVYYQEAWHSTNPPTVELGDEHELLYHVNFYVTTTPQENNPPDDPTLISPANGSTVESSNSATLKVEVTDPDEDPMDVYFYNDSDDSLIGSATDVDSGDSAQVSWSGLSANTTYHWYAVANDSQLETKSDTWSFTTKENNPPDKPTDPIPENNSENVDINPYLSVNVTDPDDDNMNVSFFDAFDDSLIGTDTNVENGSTASIIWSGLSYNSTYHWYAVANDSQLETKSDTWIFTTKENNPPDKPTDPIPENNSENVDINPYLSVNVTDPDDDNMNVSFFDAFDDSLIGTDLNVVSGGIASVQWVGLSGDTAYTWYAIANDSELETKSDTWSFTTKEIDNNPPCVKITKPEKALYIFNFKIRKYLFRFRIPLIIGKITIEANATDEDSGIERVEFYINDELKETDTTEPYTYLWRWNRPRIFHIFTIKVVAYDNEGATAEDYMIARKFL